MRWLARQSPARALLIAAAWPLLVIGVVAATIGGTLYKAHQASGGAGGVYVAFEGDPSILTAVTILLLPSLLFLMVWHFARRTGPPAT